MLIKQIFLAALPVGTLAVVTFEPTKAPSPVPTIVDVCSEWTCQRLGWDPLKFGSTTICGESDALTGSCSGALDWDAAREFCQGNGARLCTLAEVLNDETRDSGCNYDSAVVWSATSCGVNSFSVSLGFTDHGTGMAVDWTECRERTTAANTFVRCCADVDGCSPTPQPTRFTSLSTLFVSIVILVIFPVR